MGLVFSFSSPVLADDPVLDTFTQAHNYLLKALGAGPDSVPSIAERIDLVKQAQAVLKNAPPAHYGHHRKSALGFIKSALFELGKGDPDNRATDYIRSADSEVRDVE
jgi:hypothetical protein